MYKQISKLNMKHSVNKDERLNDSYFRVTKGLIRSKLGKLGKIVFIFTYYICKLARENGLQDVINVRLLESRFYLLNIKPLNNKIM